MESSNRRLSFDSCEQDYESCDSVQGHIANHTEIESYQVTPSPFRATQSSTSNYTLHQMTEDLLCPDGISGLTMEEMYDSTHSEEREVVPQKLENFKKITGIQKSKIIFKCDESTQIISKAMITEHEMILRQVRQTLSISGDDYPTVDDFIKYFFGPVSRLTGIFLQELEIDYLTFLKWLSTIFILQAYRMSFTLLNHQDGALNKNILTVSNADSSSSYETIHKLTLLFYC